MSHENVEDVRTSIEAYQRGDDAAATAYLAPEVVWEVGQELPARRPAAVRDVWKRWHSEWEELEMIAEEFIDAGDSVVVAMHYRGRGRVSGIAVNDRQFEVLTFRQRQCVRKVDYRERSDAIEAVGLRECPARTSMFSSRDTTKIAAGAPPRLSLLSWFTVRVRGELDSADKALKSAGITVQEAFGGFDGKLNLVALGAVVEAKTEVNAVAQVRDKLPDGDFDLEVDPPASDELAREPRFERRHPLPGDSV